MRVLIIGEVCIDNNEVEGSKYEYVGGPCLYLPISIKNFKDTEIRIINNYGNDLDKFNVSVRKFFVSEKPNVGKTLRYRNIVEKGHRTQYAENYEFEKFYGEENLIKEEISQADLIFFAPLIPTYSVEYIKELLTNSKEETVKICLPQGYFRKFDSDGLKLFREFKEANELLPLFNFSIFSDEDYPNILELSKDWAKNYKTDIIITRGKDGADIYYGADWFFETQRLNIPTNPVANIKDSTGSGEIFSGSFGYMYTKTRDTAKSIHFANKVAGKCLLYTPDEIENLNVLEAINE